jgi:hypothetical protein
MSTSTTAPDRFPTAIAAAVSDDRLRVTLVDGRELTVPIAWWDWLAGATDAQRSDLEIIEGGQGLWWDQLDDGLSVPGLFGLPHA